MRLHFILATVIVTTTQVLGQTPPLKSAKELQAVCITALQVFEHADNATPSTNDASAYGQCVGYVQAVVDSLRNLTKTGADGKTYRFHLHGDGLNVKDAILVFLDFVKKDNGSSQDSPAAEIVTKALSAQQIITTSLVGDRPRR